MKIRTYFEGSWHEGSVQVMSSSDHGIWLGTTVFDGARYFEGVAPDLDAHCARVNRSAEALMLTPSVEADAMVEIVEEGLKSFSPDEAVYIRPMYWGVEWGDAIIAPKSDSVGFAIALEAIPLPSADSTTTLGTTQFRRPVLADNVVNAKAGCLYPNNARMRAEVRRKGCGNALVCDAMGNVAESATSNVFMVRDGEVLTPVANGTFLAGITRARHMSNLTADGYTVHEAVLTMDDFHSADEVFLTGNASKITPVTALEDTSFQVGPVARRARALYWDWAHSA